MQIMEISLANMHMHCQHTPARAAVREGRCKLRSTCSCNTKHSWLHCSYTAGAMGRTCNINRVRHGELVTSVQGHVCVAYVKRPVHHACGLLSRVSAPILLRLCSDSAPILLRLYFDSAPILLRFCYILPHIMPNILSALSVFHAIWKPRAVCGLHGAVCRLHGGHAVCRLRGHRFNELHARVCFGEITSKKTERIVMIL